MVERPLEHGWERWLKVAQDDNGEKLLLRILEGRSKGEERVGAIYGSRKRCLMNDLGMERLGLFIG